jgi:RNA polymerase sigma-B factor
MALTLEAQHDLILSHAPLAKSLAARYRGQGVPFEDLVGEATLGLTDAARRFDPDRIPPRHFGEYARAFCLKRIIQAIDSELQSRLPLKLADVPATEPDLYLERAESELWSAVEILDADDFQLLCERYGLGGISPLGIAVIANRRSASVATIKRRLDEIRKALRLELVKRGWKSGENSSPPMQAQLNLA